MLAQCAFIVHSTHAVAPSQNFPPPSVQEVPAALGMFTGAPALHASVVHSSLSSRMSVSSLTIFSPPLPSHCVSLQSLSTCSDVGVPAGVFETPHTPMSHVRF
jgi:hypothetical protein